MKHTKEPWKAIGVDDSYEILDINETYDVAWGIDSETNAQRIIRCINACAGITDEALDAGVVESALVHVAGTRKENLFYGGVKVWEDV